MRSWPDWRKDDVFCRLVKVDVASHSPQMEPLAAELAVALDELIPGPARVPIYSTALGRRAEGQAFGAGYWARNLREPVLFSTAVGLLAGDGVTVFLELGPHPILLPSVQQTVPTATMIACARRDEPEQAAFLTMLGSLWAAGTPIDWRRVMPEGGTTVRLPLYPWQRERHWADAAEMRPAGAAASPACLRPDEEARGWLYRLEWKPSEIPPAGMIAAKAAARWIVVTGDEAMGSAVAAAFAAAGVTSEVVPVCLLEAAFRAQTPAARAAYGIVVLAEDDQEAAFLPLRVLQSYLASTGASTGAVASAFLVRHTRRPVGDAGSALNAFRWTRRRCGERVVSWQRSIPISGADWWISIPRRRPRSMPGG